MKRLINWRKNQFKILLVFCFLVGACFVFKNSSYLNWNPFLEHEFGYEASRINYGEDGFFYVRTFSNTGLLKINQESKIEKIIYFKNQPLNTMVEQYVTDEKGNIYTVEIDPKEYLENKTSYAVKKYNNNGKLLKVLEQFDSSLTDINHRVVSPIYDFHLKEGVLLLGELKENVLIVKAYEKDVLQNIFSCEKKANFINNLEDYIYVLNQNSLIVILKNGKILLIDSSGQTKRINSLWQEEVPWNIVSDTKNGFYYTDLEKELIYHVELPSLKKVPILKLDDCKEFIDNNYKDEILRNFSVGKNGKVCLNARKNILLVDSKGNQEVYVAKASFTKTLKSWLFLVWGVLLFCLSALLYFLFLLMRYLVRYPAELAKVMFYLFLIAVAGLMAAKLTQDNIWRDYKDTIVKDNQQIAVIASRLFDAEAIDDLKGKSDFSNESFQKLLLDAEKVLRPAGEKTLSVDRTLNLYKFDETKIRVLLTNSWRSLWQPIYRNETTERLYQFAESKSFESFIDDVGAKTYLTSYAPVFNKENQVVALVEVGYDLSNIYNELNMQFWRDMIGILFLLVTFHLIIVEMNQVFVAWKKTQALGQPLRKSTSLIRLISFLTYMTVSMSLLYCTARIAQLDQSFLILPKELIMALPFAVEMLAVVVLNLFLSKYMDAWGWKPQMLFGGFLMIVGCIITWQTDSMLFFLLGRVFNGAAFAVQVNALKAFIVCEKDLEARKKGQAERTTGRFAGGLCGITIGTLIAVYLPIETTFFCSAVVGILLLLAVYFLTENKKTGEVKEEQVSTLKAFWLMLKEKRILWFLVLVFFPLYFLDGFCSYLVPVMVKSNDLNKDYIGYASFLVYLCCAYFSKPLALKLSRKISLYNCILLGLGLYAIAAILLQFLGGLTGILLSSIIFGVGISINGGLITEMFLRSYITKNIGVNNMNNICGILFALKSGLGPVILGYFWKLNTSFGVIIYCAIALILAISYIAIYRKDLALK